MTGIANSLTMGRRSFAYRGPIPLQTSKFSASGVIHLRMLLTLGHYDRSNGQENLWATQGWVDASQGRSQDELVGSLDAGSATATAMTNAPTLTRMARWDRSGDDDRFIFNANAGDLGAQFNSGDPYILTVVRAHEWGVSTISLDAPSAGGNATFVDWQVDATTNHLTAAEWTFITGMASGDEVLVAIHQGTGTYTP